MGVRLPVKGRRQVAAANQRLQWQVGVIKDFQAFLARKPGSTSRPNWLARPTSLTLEKPVLFVSAGRELQVKELKLSLEPPAGHPDASAQEGSFLFLNGLIRPLGASASALAPGSLAWNAADLGKHAERFRPLADALVELHAKAVAGR
jgi:hypothetical protein